MEGWTAEDLAAHYRRLTTPPELAEMAQDVPVAPKPRKPSQRKEEQIQRQIIDLLEAHGWLVLRTNKFCGQAVATQGAIEPGMPDLMARHVLNPNADALGREYTHSWLIPWLILWIEVKRPGGECSETQKAWHLLAKVRGETVLVAESVEEVARAIGVRL